MSITLNEGSGGSVLRTRISSTGVVSGEHTQLVESVTSNFLLEVGKGNIAGHALRPVFGYNPDIGASTTEDINFSGALNFLQAVSAVRIKVGGNAADDTAGAGAQTVLVDGLDSAFLEVSETLTTAGASASSPTTQTFIRVNKATVVNVGTYGAGAASTAGANTGNIEIETTGGTLLMTIEAGVGSSENSLYTVPAAKSAHLVRLSITPDSAKAADIRLWKRLNADDVSTPFGAKNIVRRYPGLLNPIEREADAHIIFSAKTDIWLTATTGSGGSARASTVYDLILVDD
jgi:hypothetical protein